MSTSQETWHRVRLTGKLTVTSPLHIGDGETINSNEGEDKTKESVLISTVCKDNNGNPYIPASTLKGALRSMLDDEDLSNTLFGLGSQDEIGNMGAIRCYDATWSKSNADNPSISTIARTSIHPELGVAEAHKLFSAESVSVGKKFDLVIELDHTNQKEVEQLLGVIEALNQHGQGIGRGQTTSQGRLNWSLEQHQYIDDAALQAWATDTVINKTTDGETGETTYQTSDLPWKTLTYTPTADTTHCRPAFAHNVGFEIEFHSPWLVNDPSHVNKEEKHAPDLEFSRSGDKALLPATSLKGWIRQRARRILRTLLEDTTGTNQKAEACLNHLFGSTEQSSWLIISDAVSNTRIANHVQQFNAIDRFTNGGKEGALYKVNAVSPCQVYGNIGIKNPPTEEQNWQIGLLGLVLRDAMEGDLTLGWGKARGFGQARIALTMDASTTKETIITEWLEFVDSYGSALQPYISALQTRITTLIQEDSEVNHD